MRPQDELSAFIEDSINNIRAVKGDEYADVLQMLYGSVSMGQIFAAAIDERVSQPVREAMFAKYAMLMDTLFSHVLPTFKLSRDDYEEMWVWADTFTKKTQEMLINVRKLH